MAVTVSGTGITFNDATVQTTAATGGVTSAVAGNGVAVSGATGAVTFSLGAPTSASVGTYLAAFTSASGVTSQNAGSTTAGSTLKYGDMTVFESFGPFTAITAGSSTSYSYSGTWRAMGYQRQDTSSYNQVQPNFWLRIA